MTGSIVSGTLRIQSPGVACCEGELSSVPLPVLPKDPAAPVHPPRLPAARQKSKALQEYQVEFYHAVTIHLISVTLIKPPTLHISMTLQKHEEPIQQVALPSQPETRGFHLGAGIQKRPATSLAANSHRPESQWRWNCSGGYNRVDLFVLLIGCQENTDPSVVAEYHGEICSLLS